MKTVNCICCEKNPWKDYKTDKPELNKLIEIRIGEANGASRYLKYHEKWPLIDLIKEWRYPQ